MIAPAAAVLGLVIGSFLNVVIHRVPRRSSVMWPASSCPQCGQPIAPKDNIPLVSYLLLRGRCRKCGERIPMRYPLIEALTAILFGAAGYEFGFSIQLISALVLISALISLAAIDLEHGLLPNAIVAPCAAVGFVLSVLGDPTNWWIYLLSILAVGGGLLALALVFPAGMGMGDVKMGGMLGAFLGPYGALAVFLGALSGTIVGGLLLAVGRIRRRSPLPFGVFMAFGGLVTLFEGPELFALYLRLVGV
ncbi:MAG TPA: prepilin peptidase [Rubrobacter sp.]|nr:prepilin peptidase [Rubrobacter sp.]